MRRLLLLIVCQFGLLAGSGLSADVVTLKDGRQISGSLDSGNTQELHIKAADQSQTIDIHEVQAVQLGVSVPAAATAAPAKAADTIPDSAPPNTLFLKDGTRVAGRWWSLDATQMHFLVNSQLQHYPRADVVGVSFGAATLPAPPAPASPPPASAPRPASSPTPPAASAQPPASAAPPGRPTLVRPSERPAQPAPPTLSRPSASTPSASAPPAKPPQGLSEPEEIGMVYSWNGKVLIPLEVNQAVERKSGSTQYWEMPGPQSKFRVSEASLLVFILRLPKGVDPAGYSLFPLVSVNGARRTKTQAGRRGGVMTWPVDIEINDQSSLITYAIKVKDLPAGEYSFSPSSSNDGYCFGVDAAPGQ